LILDDEEELSGRVESVGKEPRVVVRGLREAASGSRPPFSTMSRA